MNGIAMQMIFSPQNCSLELLDKTLTADRRKLAKQILARIQGSIQTRTSHYSLIIGARGTGKTHLLTYIWKHLHAQYANDSSIKIISLAEEERGITSLLDFLIACMRSVGISGDVVASRIRDGGYPSPAEAARELFHEVVTAESTLIVIENLSYIFESLEEEGLADLRGFFQDHPSISVLASSVTLFTDSSKADNPFYGFFNIHPLKPLDRKDARMYLLIQSRAKGDAELATALEKEESQARVNAIYDLTGGNHRLLAMLSTFLSADGLAELVGPFVQMADRELTPYYQQRLDRLSPQQNKLVRVIADYHGRALSVNEIAHAAFLTPQSVSRQLYDLLHGGYVVRNQVGRESCYELREPLLRLVLDIKEGRDRSLSLIVKFLRSWYSVEELTKLVAAAPLYVQRYYDTARTEKKQVKEDRPIEAHTRHEPVAWLKEKLGQDILRKAVIAAKSSEWSTLSEFFDQFFEEVPEEPRAWFTGAVALQLSGCLEAALAAYDEVVKRFSDSDRVELLEPVAKAMVNKGVTLGALQRSEDEIAAYDEVVKRFSDSDRAELLEPVARAMVNKGFRLGELQRSEDEIAAYDEVVKRFSDSDRVELLEPVA
ncbi:MAG: hypothetical protein KAV87_02145, partial [Desulfobacteraceae bacterium]|nr:hypothetical protein [Desulfobacteraceae bacterium]